MKNKVLVYAIVGLICVGAFFAAATLYKSAQQEKLDWIATAKSEIFVRDHSPKYGDPEAKVVIIEFLDPECESCRAFYPAVKSLLEEFKGQVQLAVRYAPFHQNSVTAIRALEAARLQGKYWEALELLFYYQPQWGDHHNPRPELIFEYLPQLELNMSKLKKDMDAPKIQAIIDQDIEDLQVLDIRATPTFFVNGRPLLEFSFEELRYLVESEIAEAYN